MFPPRRSLEAVKMPSMVQNIIALGLGLAGVASAACNGADELCSRKYSNVTFVGAHDSAFVGTELTDNQYISVEDQLNMGVRFLQAQTHNWIDGIELCHTSCLEKDAGPLSDYLSTVKSWLDANPNEVLTMLLTNGDSINVANYGDLFESAGLDQYTFSPGSHLSMDEWPTLQTMINDGHRLVVFMGAPVSDRQNRMDWLTRISQTTTPTRRWCRTSWRSLTTSSRPRMTRRTQASRSARSTGRLELRPTV